MIRFALTAVFFAGLMTLYAQNTGRPNVVVIIADDLGYGDVGFNGGQIETPFLDELAADGMRFTDFHTSGTLCSPTRAGIMTGLYQYRVGVPGVIVAFPGNPAHKRGLIRNAATFPQLLKQKGYTTGLFGKWHLGYADQYNPVHYGFDQFRGYLSGQVDYHSHIDLAGTFDWWEGPEKRRDSGYTTHLITRQAIGFIKENSNRPFCVVISHQAVHNPYQGPADDAFRTEGVSIPDVPVAQQVRDKRATFALMMQEMDKGIGEVREALKDLGIDRNTLIFFLSDNGGVQAVSSNAPFRGGKGQVWEGGHRVPLVACWPGEIKAGQTTDILASSLDLMPTILELTATPYPHHYHPDGVSLAPLLINNKVGKHRTFFWNMENQEYEYAVRRRQWKLVVTKAGKPLLFDLSVDKMEKTDLAAGHPRRVKEMQQAYTEWKRDVGVDQYYKKN